MIRSILEPIESQALAIKQHPVLVIYDLVVEHSSPRILLAQFFGLYRLVMCVRSRSQVV